MRVGRRGRGVFEGGEGVGCIKGMNLHRRFGKGEKPLEI